MCLMGWRELEQRVCGEPRIDLELLKSITKYDGEYRRQGVAHPVIERFWKVMEGFSETERAAVVGFAWGRSRLPPAASLTAIAFNIDASHGGDDFVPTSSTCDFRLHLPQVRFQTSFSSRFPHPSGLIFGQTYHSIRARAL